MSGFLRDESAAGLVDYALIPGIVSITVIIEMVFLRDQITNLFSTIGNSVNAGGGLCQRPNQQGQCS